MNWRGRACVPQTLHVPEGFQSAALPPKGKRNQPENKMPLPSLGLLSMDSWACSSGCSEAELTRSPMPSCVHRACWEPRLPEPGSV